MSIVLAARRPATAPLAQTRASYLNLCSDLHRPSQISTLTAGCSCAATPSIDPLHRVGCLRAPHPQRSNPHRGRCTTASPFPRFRPLEVFVRRPPECVAAFEGGRHPKQAAEFQTVAHGGGLLKMRDYGPHSTQKHPHDRRRNVLVASADDGGHDDQKLRRSEGLQARPTKATSIPSTI